MLQAVLKYVYDSDVKCILLSEVSRLGGNTKKTLSLINDLQNNDICLYIEKLSSTLGAESEKDRIFISLILSIMPELARLDSETLSYWIESGIRERKDKGLHVGRKVESTESVEKLIAKHKKTIMLLNIGRSYKEIQAITGTAPATTSTIKKVLAAKN